METQSIKKISFTKDDLVCVEIDDIYPLRLMSRVQEKKIEFQTHRINPRKDLRDFILTINKEAKKHKSIDNKEYIVGSLLKDDNGVFFKPLCTEQLILLGSDCIKLANDYYFTPYFNFKSSYGEIKFLSLSDVKTYCTKYPNDYADKEKIRNLVLNHALCVEIDSLRRLKGFSDDGIWELTFNEQFKEEYARKLKKRKLFAQQNLIQDYVNAYEFYDDLDLEKTKEARKTLIKQIVLK